MTVKAVQHKVLLNLHRSDASVSRSPLFPPHPPPLPILIQTMMYRHSTNWKQRRMMASLFCTAACRSARTSSLLSTISPIVQVVSAIVMPATTCCAFDFRSYISICRVDEGG